MVIRERKKKRKEIPRERGKIWSKSEKNAKMLHVCVKVKCVDNKQKEKMWGKGGKGKPWFALVPIRLYKHVYTYIYNCI